MLCCLKHRLCSRRGLPTAHEKAHADFPRLKVMHACMPRAFLQAKTGEKPGSGAWAAFGKLGIVPGKYLAASYRASG